jgi:thiamine kinase-like enzyme
MTQILEDIIARVPLWAEAQDLRYQPLGGGITNKNYRVDVDSQSYVLRIAGVKTELLGIDRLNEYIANSAAGKLGIAPEVVYYIQPEGYLVTHFLTAGPLPPDELRLPANLRKVAELLKNIHGMADIPGEFSVFRVVEDYARVARGYDVQFPDNYDWLLEQMYAAEQAFQSDALPLRPCHNDLLNENFLKEGEHIYLLDWEYAGMGDIYFDLANLSVNHGFTDDEDHMLLEAYFGELSAVNWARLKVMKILSDFRESMWGMVQIGISDLDFDFHAYADKHFDRMTKNIKDDRWEKWLATIRNQSLANR